MPPAGGEIFGGMSKLNFPAPNRVLRQLVDGEALAGFPTSPFHRLLALAAVRLTTLAFHRFGS